MNNDDLMNDALDARIQQAVANSRGSTLEGMAQKHVPTDPDADAEYAEGLKGIAGETEEEDEKKKQGGGLDIGSIAGMAGSMMGG